jgi:hypothetical protein
MAPARPPTMACLRELDMLIMFEDAVESSLRDPASAARVWLGVAVELALVMKLEVEVGEYEMEPPTGSYDNTSVDAADADAEVLEAVGMLKEKRG